MSTKKSTALKSVALGVGGLVALSLTAAGASAAPGGNFLVKSVNAADSTIFSLEGHIPAGSSGPGGSEGPGEVENPADAVLYTMKCGPASFPVTESMREFSNSNAADYTASGNLDGLTPHADGWSLLAADNKLGEAIPAAKPGALILVGTSPTRVMGSVSESAAGCNYGMNDRTKPGLHFYSYQVANGSYSEGRTAGSIYSQVTRYSDGTTAVSRSVPSATAAEANRAFKSSTLPYEVVAAPADTRIAVALPATTDGYNHIESRSYADGSGWVQFRLTADPKNGDNNYPLAKRQAGPSLAYYNAAGLITKFAYAGNETPQTPSSPLTVAQYNALTGQNWDGDFHKPSSFDLSVPFEPTAP